MNIGANVIDLEIKVTFEKTKKSNQTFFSWLFFLEYSTGGLDQYRLKK